MTVTPRNPPPDVPGRIRLLSELDAHYSNGHRPHGLPEPTRYAITTKTGRRLRYWSDGSLRHEV